MDKVNQDEWQQTIDAFRNKNEGIRDHFAQLIILLAKCYNDDLKHKAVVLIDTGDAVLTFCAGANEMEMAELVSQAYDTSQAIVLRDAPPKEMFN